MAGTKGRSGGARAGAGRPPKEPNLLGFEGYYSKSDEFLEAVMNDRGTDVKLRVDAAKALLSAEIRRAEAGGKKEQKQAAAERVVGRFAPAAPPKLAAANGKKV